MNVIDFYCSFYLKFILGEGSKINECFEIFSQLKRTLIFCCSEPPTVFFIALIFSFSLLIYYMIYILFTATFLYCNLLQKGTSGLRIRQTSVSVLFDPLNLRSTLAEEGNSYPHLVALLHLSRLLPIQLLFDFDGSPLLHLYRFLLSMEI